MARKAREHKPAGALGVVHSHDRQLRVVGELRVPAEDRPAVGPALPSVDGDPFYASLGRTEAGRANVAEGEGGRALHGQRQSLDVIALAVMDDPRRPPELRQPDRGVRGGVGMAEVDEHPLGQGADGLGHQRPQLVALGHPQSHQVHGDDRQPHPGARLVEHDDAPGQRRQPPGGRGGRGARSQRTRRAVAG